MLLKFFAADVIYQWSPSTSIFCCGIYLDKRAERTIYLFCGFLYLFPVSMVVFCYAGVYRFVRKHNAAIAPSPQDANSPGTIRAQEIKASESRVMFATVLGSYLNWIPSIVISILNFGFQVYIPDTAHLICLLLMTISAWINPIIYGVMNQAMRKEFRNILF